MLILRKRKTVAAALRTLCSDLLVELEKPDVSKKPASVSLPYPFYFPNYPTYPSLDFHKPANNPAARIKNAMSNYHSGIPYLPRLNRQVPPRSPRATDVLAVEIR